MNGSKKNGPGYRKNCTAGDSRENIPDLEKKGMEVLAVEEHPFTLGFMEWEKFDFRIRLMIK